jgi:hypothetical protein
MGLNFVQRLKKIGSNNEGWPPARAVTRGKVSAPSSAEQMHEVEALLDGRHVLRCAEDFAVELDDERAPDTLTPFSRTGASASNPRDKRRVRA